MKDNLPHDADCRSRAYNRDEVDASKQLVCKGVFGQHGGEYKPQHHLNRDLNHRKLYCYDKAVDKNVCLSELP